MITKKCIVFLWSVIFAFGVNTTVEPVGVTTALKWVKQKFASKHVARDVAMEVAEPIVAIPATPIEHTIRTVLFENNIPQFFDALKDDPAYADLPNLMDQTIIVNGKAIMPGTSSEITIEDGRGMVTIKLHKGFAKIIYAMQQGTLRGILMKLLKHVEPWLQWQYSVPFTINKDIDFVQLSDLVLSAYNKSLDQNAVNQRFKYILVVDLSLNEPIDL